MPQCRVIVPVAEVALKLILSHSLSLSLTPLLRIPLNTKKNPRKKVIFLLGRRLVQSPLQELEVGPCGRPYLLVFVKWVSIYCVACREGLLTPVPEQLHYCHSYITQARGQAGAVQCSLLHYSIIENMSQKYIGSAGALLPGKFLRIQKVFSLNILLYIISGTCLENHWCF